MDNVTCRRCGEDINYKGGRKPEFCSAKCRVYYWREKPKEPTDCKHIQLDCYCRDCGKKNPQDEDENNFPGNSETAMELAAFCPDRNCDGDCNYMSHISKPSETSESLKKEKLGALRELISAVENKPVEKSEPIYPQKQYHPYDPRYNPNTGFEEESIQVE